MRWIFLGLVVVGCTGGEPAPFGEYRGKAGGVGALPGLAPHNATLQRRFGEAPPQKEVRSKHLAPDGKPLFTNRLVLESSPYLRQHAHNPVNWFAWGEEPFELARRLKRPVLLSVGYSTCHWCHVMEEESFDDLEIAAYLNQHYVVIKVDREERPDIDGVYMNAVTAMSGRGGWPMTVWLTPDKKPFYGATYIPARDGDRGVEHGFLTILESVETAYFEDGPDVLTTADRLTAALQATLSPEPLQGGTELARDQSIVQTIEHYRGRFDKKWGGLKGAPKFPSSLPLKLLLRYVRRTGDKDVEKQVRLTLDKMFAGAMYDHVGGGFHRYSVNEQWSEPHYEKMLYDNALLASLYLEGFQATGDLAYVAVVRDVLEWVERDMSAEEGGFYTAIDADSKTPGGSREEGYFYTWTPEEYQKALPAKYTALAEAAYALVEQSNGRWAVIRKSSVEEVAQKLKIPSAKGEEELTSLRYSLWQGRRERAAPFRDEKQITAWNALMISALAGAGVVLSHPPYLERAKKAEAFLWEKAQQKGRLQRRVGSRAAGFLDDYGFLLAAELDLFQATSQPVYLERALALHQSLTQFFAAPDGGYYSTASDHEAVLAREKPAFDGAVPSGNSVMAMNLLRLYQWTSKESFLNQWTGVMQALGAVVAQNPWGLSDLLLSVDFRKDHTKQVVLVVPPSQDPTPFLAVLRKSFFPNHVRVVLEGDRQPASLVEAVPLVRGKMAQKGKVTAYVCEEGVCKLPTSSPKVFRAQMERFRPLKGGK